MNGWNDTNFFEIMRRERSLNGTIKPMNTFWTNPVTHAVVMAVVLIGTFVLSQGGAWQTVSVGTVLTAVISYLHGKSLMGK